MKIIKEKGQKFHSILVLFTEETASIKSLNVPLEKSD